MQTRIVVALASCVLALSFNAGIASAQGGGGQSVQELKVMVAQLQATLTALQAQVNALQSLATTHNAEIDQLQASLADASAKLRFVTVDGSEMYITGANLNIRDGSGTTSGTSDVTPDSFRQANPNGLGNLIIGYNETDGTLVRTGSHNLIIGAFHSYLSVGGLLAGYQNTVSGWYSSVTGGANNLASQIMTSVSGGQYNRAGCTNTDRCGDGSYASVAGGRSNLAHGFYSMIAGGNQNDVGEGNFSAVFGGEHNSVDDHAATAIGGHNCAATIRGTTLGGRETCNAIP